MKNLYSNLKESYPLHQGVLIGGLGEVTLTEPLCFCTSKETIKGFEKNSIIRDKETGIEGVCQKKRLCFGGKCQKNLQKYCQFNKIYG
jgi:hypothetical protein